MKNRLTIQIEKGSNGFVIRSVDDEPRNNEMRVATSIEDAVEAAKSLIEKSTTQTPQTK